MVDVHHMERKKAFKSLCIFLRGNGLKEEMSSGMTPKKYKNFSEERVEIENEYQTV